jgi:prepilin-type N-terminal cleavage/methylation domain-containing protein
VKKVYGFTVVELLIVIIVVAILATIGIVSYRSIQTKAMVASLKVDLSHVGKRLEIFHIENGRYPSSSGTMTDMAQILKDTGLYEQTRETGTGGKTFVYCARLDFSDYIFIGYGPVKEDTPEGILYVSSIFSGKRFLTDVDADSEYIGTRLCRAVAGDSTDFDKFRWTHDI